MIFTSVKQLKDVVKNTENRLGLLSNTLLNYYMMERFLCRLCEREKCKEVQKRNRVRISPFWK